MSTIPSFVDRASLASLLAKPEEQSQLGPLNILIAPLQRRLFRRVNVGMRVAPSRHFIAATKSPHQGRRRVTTLAPPIYENPVASGTALGSQ